MPGADTFSIGEALSFGWKKLQENIGPLVAAALVILVVNALFALLVRGGGFAATIFGLISWFVSILISMGLIRIALKIVDGGQAEVADLFQQSGLALPYIIAGFIFSIVVSIGLAFLILPGIYLAITLGFFGYNIVDKEMPAIESLQKSAEITRDQKWELFSFGLVLFFFNLLGLLLLGVGVLITAPVSFLATAYVYRKLAGEPVAE